MKTMTALLVAFSFVALGETSALPSKLETSLEKSDIDFFFDCGSTGIKIFPNPASFPGVSDWEHGLNGGRQVKVNTIDGRPLRGDDFLSVTKSKEIALKVKAELMKFVASVDPWPTKSARTHYPIVTVAMAATAGNRGRSDVLDASLWTRFNRVLQKDGDGIQVNLKQFQGSQKHTAGADVATVWGTNEAIFEAKAALSAGPQYYGFFSSGGASAQFGMKMCNAAVAQAWRNILEDDPLMARILNSQCHGGTQLTPRQVISWSTDAHVREVNGDDLDADMGACTGDGECWALGSLFQCPGAGFVMTDGNTEGTSKGVGGWRVTANSIAGADTFGEDISMESTLDLFAEDHYLIAIRPFVDMWRTQCLGGNPERKVAMLISKPAQTQHALLLHTATDDMHYGPSKFSDFYSYGWYTSLGFIDITAGRNQPVEGTGFGAMVGKMDEINWGATIGKYASDTDDSLEDLDMEIQALEHTL